MLPQVALDPAIATALAVSGLACVLGPVALAVWWHRTRGAPYPAFFWGALVFIVFQGVLRLPWQIPLAAAMRSHPEWSIAFIAFSAFTAGLFEEVGRWLGYAYLLKRERSVRVGVMFGLGHGGVESALLVGASLLGSLAMWVLAAQGLVTDPRVLAALVPALATLSMDQALYPLFERVAALGLQVGLSLVVLLVFLRGQQRWLWMAVAIHAGIDFVAVMMHTELQWPVAVTQVTLAVMAALVLGLAYRAATRSEAARAG